MPLDRKSPHELSWPSRLIIAAVVASLVPFSATANPKGGVVGAGEAFINESGKNLTVRQATDKAVIDWRSFNIAPGEHTDFQQPSSGSITLNRINDTQPSLIN